MDIFVLISNCQNGLGCLVKFSFSSNLGWIYTNHLFWNQISYLFTGLILGHFPDSSVLGIRRNISVKCSQTQLPLPYSVSPKPPLAVGPPKHTLPASPQSPFRDTHRQQTPFNITPKLPLMGTPQTTHPMPQQPAFPDRPLTFFNVASKSPQATISVSPQSPIRERQPTSFPFTPKSEKE